MYAVPFTLLAANATQIFLSQFFIKEKSRIGS
jgi:hypothetical protein